MPDHRKSFPTPGAVTHVISVCEITAHPVAVYFSVDPGGPYCAATSVCELGPKFVPEIEIAAPPYVVVPLAAIASPERPLIDGTIYFVVDEDACTRCALCVDRCPTGVISLGKFAGSLADAAISNGIYESPWDEDSGERSDRHGYIYGRL